MLHAGSASHGAPWHISHSSSVSSPDSATSCAQSVTPAISHTPPVVAPVVVPPVVPAVVVGVPVESAVVPVDPVAVVVVVPPLVDVAPSVPAADELLPESLDPSDPGPQPATSHSPKSTARVFILVARIARPVSHDRRPGRTWYMRRMVRLTLRHEIHCDEATFWQHFFDPELCRRLYLEGLEFPSYETEQQDESPAKITRTVKIVPKLTMPAPLARAFGSSFRYKEQGEFDKASKTWRWRLISGALADKITVLGTLRAPPLGDGRVAREVDITIEAKVMFLGGTIEETFRKQLTDGWNRSAEVQNQWLRESATG